jgi:hypothetical protein
MTKEEAINVLDGLQRAFKALDRAKAVQAFNTLVNTSGVVTTDFQLAGDFGGALNVLGRVFDAIDRKGIDFSSN